MSDGLLFIVVSLAAYRLWRLLALDTLPLVRAPRERLELWMAGRWGDEWSDGIACAWCLGFWCACVVVGATWAVRPLPLPALWFAAVSGAVGLAAMVIED